MDIRFATRLFDPLAGACSSDVAGGLVMRGHVV